MTLARTLPAALAFLLLAAHFWRAGQVALAALAVALVALPFVRKPWAPTAAQVALVLGALEWLRTLAAFAAERVAQDRPFTRLVAILGAVIAFNLWAAWRLRAPKA
jgi:hypothetical protein